MSRRKAVIRLWRWRVRELAAEKSLSIGEIARRAGVSSKTVRAFCTNPQHETTIDMWSRLAKALGVTRNEMLEIVESVVEGKDYRTPVKECRSERCSE